MHGPVSTLSNSKRVKKIGINISIYLQNAITQNQPEILSFRSTNKLEKLDRWEMNRKKKRWLRIFVSARWVWWTTSCVDIKKKLKLLSRGWQCVCVRANTKSKHKVASSVKCQTPNVIRETFGRPSSDNGVNRETKTMLWRIQTKHLKQRDIHRDERKISRRQILVLVFWVARAACK